MSNELNYSPDPAVSWPRRGEAPTSSPPKGCYRDIDVDETGALVVGRSAKLAGYYLFNTASAIRYVKLYDKSTAPTVGTDTPVMTIPLPAQSGANIYDRDGVLLFEHGIGIGATTGVADNDTGAPSANQIIANLFYS